GPPVRHGRSARHRLAGTRLARHRAAPGGPPFACPEGGQPMIRNRTWHRAMVGTVLVANCVILLVAGAALPGFLPFALVALVLATWWALARPAGWGAFTLVVAQVLCATVPGGAPTTLLQWALAAAAGSPVILTHLALTLLGSGPARADLPRATALRWGAHAAALVWVAI